MTLLDQLVFRSDELGVFDQLLLILAEFVAQSLLIVHVELCSFLEQLLKVVALLEKLLSFNFKIGLQDLHCLLVQFFFMHLNELLLLQLCL